MNLNKLIESSTEDRVSSTYVYEEMPIPLQPTAPPGKLTIRFH